MSNPDKGRQQIEAAILNFPNVFSEEIDLTALIQEEDTRKIKKAGAYQDKLLEMMLNGGEKGHPTPWEGTGGKFEFRESEVTIWSGAKGHGKSLVISQVFEKFITDDKKVFMISPEFPPHRVLFRMMIQSLGRHNVSIEMAKNWIKAVNDNLWIYDQQRSLVAKDVPLICRYAVQNFGVDHILIDSLMKLGIKNDDWTGQKMLVDNVQQVAHKTKVHIHIVAHASKGHGDEKIGSIHDVKGASEIADLAENVIFVWRNKAKEFNSSGKEHEPDAVFKVEAQRNGEGWIGKIPLMYNHEFSNFREVIV